MRKDIDTIRRLMAAPDTLFERLKHMDNRAKADSIAGSWFPYVKWTYSAPVNHVYAFLFLLSYWIQFQKKDSALINPENKNKSTETLLGDLFGTMAFSDLNIEEIEDQNIYKTLAEPLLWDCSNEKRRMMEEKSLKNTCGLMILCKNGDTLFFGKTALFFFLMSKKYLERITPHIDKDIRNLLFARGICESIRRRPGMYIGSVGQNGFYRLVFGLIEDLIKDAAKKIISVKLLPQNRMEISCESYHINENTCYNNHLTVASALGDFFEYEDTAERIRTEQGVLVQICHKNLVSAGIKILWKPDITIFGGNLFDFNIILDRMLELGALNPYVIYLSDAQNNCKITVPSGIEYLLERDCYSTASGEIISFAFNYEGFLGKACISFSAVGFEVRKSYVNNQVTVDGGAHADGVKIGVKKALKRFLTLYGNGLTSKNFMKHLNYVIHLQMENPRYYGATRRELENLEVKISIQKQVEKDLYDILIQNTRPLRFIYPNHFSGK